MSISTAVGKWFGLDLHRNRTVIVRMTPRRKRLEAIRFANDTSVLAAEMGRPTGAGSGARGDPALGRGLSMCCNNACGVGASGTSAMRGPAASPLLTSGAERHECGAQGRTTMSRERQRRPRRYVVPEPTPHEEEAAMSVFRFEPFRDTARELDRLMSMAASGTRAPLGMPLDVYRGEDGSYHVEADLPGVDPDSIEVTVDSGALTIQAERTPHYRESQQVIVAERSQGSFTRQLSLGEGVDSENLTADYADGVLHVTIPASPRSQPRRVEITHATGARRTISGSTVEQGDAPAGGTGGAG